jgi:outer membrane lipopolysaccharide assembly protein LptE/RlpB
MFNLRYILVMLVISTLLSACGGWRLRGTKVYDNMDVSVYVKQKSAVSVSNALSKALALYDIDLAGRAKADFILSISNERYERRLLSVSTQTGKAREVELIIKVDFDLRTAAGALVLPIETYSTRKDFIFDETSIYGTNENEKVLRRSISEETAATLTSRVISALRSYQAL